VLWPASVLRRAHDGHLLQYGGAWFDTSFVRPRRFPKPPRSGRGTACRAPTEDVGQVANLSYPQHRSSEEMEFRGGLMRLLEGRAGCWQRMGTVSTPAGGGGIVPRSGELLGCAQMDATMVGVRDDQPHAVSIGPPGYSTCVRAWFAAWWWGERSLDGRCFDTPFGLLNVRAGVVRALVVGARDPSTEAVSIRPPGYSTCVRRYVLRYAASPFGKPFRGYSGQAATQEYSGCGAYSGCAVSQHACGRGLRSGRRGTG
jgi:hypothetical protein